ncbi:ECHDC2 isoform 6 [Pongo abelii]|uniref:ECHDC2 isoform 6 n=1 Tax=Pongo abelii TaxID=9601 RepID=A0A2J8V8R9_PONAB|nr:ECHDC2 isoform 6 [Pongo abelii]
MLRVLCLLRPWRPLRARGCASDGAAGGSEIQVRALAGPDQGKCAVPGRAHDANGTRPGPEAAGAGRL